MCVCSSVQFHPVYRFTGFPQWISSKESAGSAGDVGSTPKSGRSPGGCVFAWRIPWTEEPGGLHSIGLQRVKDTAKVT